MIITAKQARQLKKVSPQVYLKFLENLIIEAAPTKTSIVVKDAPYAYWLYDTTKISPAEKEAIEQLKSAGFKLELLYKESQFVDIGLIISWGD